MRILQQERGKLADFIQIVQQNLRNYAPSKGKGEAVDKYFLTGQIADSHLVMPLMRKVKGKTLTFQQYTLTKQQVKALAHAVQYLDSAKVNRVHFENCGLNDDDLAGFFAAFAKVRDFKAVTVKQGTVGDRGMEALPGLLAKVVPFHLEQM